MNAKDKESAVTLEILEAIERQEDVSQRHLAARLGVALGLANLYLKRCVRKGLIKIKHAPANRYLYYLTPKGFAEKSRLTGQYLVYSFDFYRKASDSMADAFASCTERGFARVLFAGVSELAEIASARAHDFKIEIVGTFDPRSTQDRLVGKPVWRRLEDAEPADVCIYTALTQSDGLPRQISSRFPVERFIVPQIVRPLVIMPPGENRRK